MKTKILYLLACFCLFITKNSYGQCSICTKSAAQMGEGPAQGMNSAIIYLALAPFLVILMVYWRWRKNKI